MNASTSGWLRPATRAAVMDLPTLWRLARHWYDGRLERGYRRRDPQTAAAYFRWSGWRDPSGACDRHVDETIGRRASVCDAM